LQFNKGSILKQESYFNIMTITKIFTIGILLFICIPGAGQTTIKLSKPRLELKDNKINIYYDILNSNQNDKFKVWIEVTDSTQNKIIPISITGDLGENVTGGNNKMIIWDFVSDSIFLDNGIYVQLNSELLISPEIKEVSKAQELMKPEKIIKRGGVIFQSVIFPGWGLSRINKGKPHWIKGVASYGCIAASVLYNKKAISSYNNYLDSDIAQDINNFYNSSVKEDKLSEVFAYSAIGIWAIDFIWTIAGSSRLKDNEFTGQAGKVMIYPVFEPKYNVSMLTLKLKF